MPIVIGVAPALIPFYASVIYGTLSSLILALLIQAIVSVALYFGYKRFLSYWSALKFRQMARAQLMQFLTGYSPVDGRPMTTAEAKQWIKDREKSDASLHL